MLLKSEAPLHMIFFQMSQHAYIVSLIRHRSGVRFRSGGETGSGVPKGDRKGKWVARFLFSFPVHMMDVLSKYSDKEEKV